MGVKDMTPDPVDEASAESFPASDPPGWISTTASGPRPEVEAMIPPGKQGSSQSSSARIEDHGCDDRNVGNTPSAPTQRGAEQPRTRNDPLLDAMDTLDAALTSPAPGNEQEWLTRVHDIAQRVQEELERHVASTEGPQGVFSGIDVTRPTLMDRVQRMRHEHADLRQRVQALQREIAHPAPSASQPARGMADIRQLAAWLMTGLRHHHAVETDLIYESLNTDIGVCD